MQISFGNKIPISTTKIYDKVSQEFKDATLYELDGKDESDINSLVYDHGGSWKYKYCMTAGLASKQNKLANGNMTDFERHLLDHNNFYVLEDSDGKLAGICETVGYLNNSDVLFIESNPNRQYGLTGQVMLASIAKQMLKNPEPYLQVSDPVPAARDFYLNSCGFEEKSPGSHEIEMKEDQMEQFILNVEQKTTAPIVDVLV